MSKIEYFLDEGSAKKLKIVRDKITEKFGNLSIFDKIDEIIEIIKDAQDFNVKSSTGSGKSVVIPLIIGLVLGQRVIVSMPTISSVKFLYKTMVDTFGKKYFGYAAAGEVHYTDENENPFRIVYVTAGHLSNRLIRYVINSKKNIEDVRMKDVTHIIIDESHTNSVEFSEIRMLKSLNQLRHICFVKMSATDIFEDDIKLLDISNETNYEIDKTIIEVDAGLKDVTGIMKSLLENVNEYPLPDNGHTLIFMPTINSVIDITEFLIERGYKAISAYSNMPRKDLDFIRDLNRNSEPHIIVTTNFLESSITIDNVVLVIDSGIEVSVFYDSLQGGKSIKFALTPFSSLQQRVGRTGRTGKGIYRLLQFNKTKLEREQMKKPEIDKTDIRIPIMRMMHCGANYYFDGIDKSKIDNVVHYLTSRSDIESIDRGLYKLKKHSHFIINTSLSYNVSRDLYSYIVTHMDENSDSILYPIICAVVTDMNTSCLLPANENYKTSGLKSLFEIDDIKTPQLGLDSLASYVCLYELIHNYHHSITLSEPNEKFILNVKQCNKLRFNIEVMLDMKYSVERAFPRVVSFFKSKKMNFNMTEDINFSKFDKHLDLWRNTISNVNLLARYNRKERKYKTFLVDVYLKNGVKSINIKKDKNSLMIDTKKISFTTEIGKNYPDYFIFGYTRSNKYVMNVQTIIFTQSLNKKNTRKLPKAISKFKDFKNESSPFEQFIEDKQKGITFNLGDINLAELDPEIRDFKVNTVEIMDETEVNTDESDLNFGY